eukprot:4268445-Prymnesium_polylepis.1
MGRTHAAAARTAVGGTPQDAQAVRRRVAWPHGHRRSWRHLDRRLAADWTWSVQRRGGAHTLRLPAHRCLWGLAAGAASGSTQ